MLNEQLTTTVILTPPQRGSRAQGRSAFGGKFLFHVLVSRACHSMAKRSLVASGLLGMTIVLSFAFFIVPAVQAECCPTNDTSCTTTDPSCPGAVSNGNEEEFAGKGLKGAADLFNVARQKAGFVGQQTSPEIVVGQIIQGLMLVIGVIFGIFIIYAGFLWMTARGNEETVKKAISILQNSVIGFILVIAAYAITNFVVDRVLGAAFQ